MSSHKRKQDVDHDVPATKRRRSSSTSTASAFLSLYDDEEHRSALDTPATPVTPATPSSKAHWRPNIYNCSYEGCGKVFNRPTRLEEHIRSHTNSRIFKCTVLGCDKDFLRQSHLAHHIKSAHTGDRDYACDWTGCDKRFSTGTRLRRHQRAHEGREQFRCNAYPPCSQTFRKRATLQKHIDVEHLNLKPFPCSQCSMGFDLAYKLKAHETTFHNGTRHWCTLCPTATEDGSSPVQGSQKGFVSYSQLQNHIQLEHPPSCNFCGLVCASPRELERHVDIHHSIVPLEQRRSFVCTVDDCNKAFTKQGNLNIHVRTVHDKEKKFICGITDLSQTKDLGDWNGADVCGQAFGAKSSLEAHVRHQHLNVPRQTRRERRKSSTGTSLEQMNKSTFAKLTGIGYAEGTGRDIECLVADCPFRFMRQYDLEIHARTTHGMLDGDIAEALAEREALSGGQFWIGNDDEEEEVMMDEKHGAITKLGAGQVDSTGPAFRLLDGPGRPTRSTSLTKVNISIRIADSAGLNMLDFQALADFCRSSQGTKELQDESAIDPLLISHEPESTSQAA